MRTSLLLLAACAACVSTAGEPERPTADQALVAGRFVMPETRVNRTLRLDTPDGGELHVAMEHDTWLVAVPPGEYNVRLVGRYAPKTPIRFEARAGEARYLGTFVFGRMRDGDLPLEVRDEHASVERELTLRHPAVERIESAVVGDAFVLRSTSSAYDPTLYRNGFLFGRSRTGRRGGR